MANSDVNSGMEGKELSLEEKIKQLINEAEKDEKGNILENPLLEINGQLFELGLEKDEKENKYKIHILGIHILTLDENDELSFRDGWEEDLEQRLKDDDSIINAKGLIKSLKNIEMEKSKRKEKNTQTESEEEKDEVDEKMENDEPEKELPQQENTGNKSNTRLIPLNTLMFHELMPESKRYKKIYIDSNTNQIVGKNKKTGEIETLEELKDIGRNRSNMSICGIEQGEHKDLQAVGMYQVSNKNVGFAITRDGTERGNFDIKYIIRSINSENEDDFRYVNLPMLESNGRIGLMQVEERTGVRQGRSQGQNMGEAIEEMHEIEESDRIEPLQKNLEDKLQPEGVTSIRELKKILKEILVNEENMEEQAAIIVVDEVIDGGKNLAVAKKEVEKGEENKNNDVNDDEDYVGYGSPRPH